MKWIDRQSAKKNGNATEMDRKFLKNFVQGLGCVITFVLIQWHFYFFFCTVPSIHFIDTSSFHFSDTWSVNPFHRHILYMQGFCLQDVRPDKICQALHTEALQDYSLILIDIDRKAVGALLCLNPDDQDKDD